LASPSVHNGHRKRLRDRALQSELRYMASHEILEFLLTYTIPLRDVNELAHHLVNRFGSLGNVLRASSEELAQTPGVGKATAEFLHLTGQAVHELARLPENPGTAYFSVMELARLLSRYEYPSGYHAVYLDSQKRLIRIMPLHAESGCVQAHLTAIFRTAIRLSAYHVVLFRCGAGGFTPMEVQLLQENISENAGLDVCIVDILVLRPSGRVKSLRAGMQEQKKTLQLHEPDHIAFSRFEETFPDWFLDLPAES